MANGYRISAVLENKNLFLNDHLKKGEKQSHGIAIPYPVSHLKAPTDKCHRIDRIRNPPKICGSILTLSNRDYFFHF